MYASEFTPSGDIYNTSNGTLIAYESNGQVIVKPGTGFVNPDITGLSYPRFYFHWQGTCTSPSNSAYDYTMNLQQFPYSSPIPLVFTNTNHFTYVQPTFLFQSPNPSVSGEGYLADLDVMINNTSPQDIDYNWVQVTPPSSFTITGAYIVSGGVETATNYYQSNGKTWVEVGSVSASGSKQVRIKGSYTDCNSFDVLIEHGWDCMGYPGYPDLTIEASDFESIDASCYQRSVTITVVPKTAQVQLAITNEPSTPQDLCTPFHIELDLISAQIADLITPYVEFDIPGGATGLTVNSVNVEYPKGSGDIQPVTTVVNGNTVHVNLIEHSGIAAINGVQGNPSVNSPDDRTAHIDIEIQLECNFIANSPLTFKAYGNSPCGEVAMGNGVRQVSSNIQVNGAIPPYSSFSTINLPNFGAPIEGCGVNETINIVTTISGGTTGSADSAIVILRPGIQYVNGSFVSNGSNVAAFGSVSTVGDHQELLLSYPSGVASGQTIDFSFDIVTLNSVCGSSEEVNIINYITVPGIACGGTNCGNFQVSTGFSYEILPLEKPNFVDGGTSTGVYTVAPNGSTDFSVDLSIENMGIDASAGYVYSAYCADANGQITGGVIGTGSLSQGINNGQTVTQTIQFTAPSSCGNNGVVIELAPSNTNCQCDTVWFYVPVYSGAPLNLDNDNDGVPDLAEAYNGDEDGDGIPDYEDPDFCTNNFDGINGWDCSTMGLPDPDDDLDGDGIPNYYDTDFPACGGLNANGVCSNFDTDGDGVPNHLDLDADNDGIADVVELGGLDANNDGVLDDITDTDGDGLSDVVDNDDTDGPNGSAPCAPQDGCVQANSTSNLLDTDADGTTDAGDMDNDSKLNFLDLDSDGDGLTDAEEASWTNTYSDTDDDGIVGTGAMTDTDGDGWSDLADSDNGGTAPSLNDFDGDGIPNFLDLDSDGDGIMDILEGVNAASPVTPSGNDSDNDGIDDAFDVDNGATSTGPEDFDNDSMPNYLDIDSDGDGIVDNIEGQSTTGYQAPGADTDGNGLADNYETAPGSGIPVSTPNNADFTDNPDFVDLDSDNDGLTDQFEHFNLVTAPSGNDSDGDGLDDSYDADGTSSTNNGGVNNGEDVLNFPNTQDPSSLEVDFRDPNSFGVPVDTDGDGLTDDIDIDDDNDGITDVDEALGFHPNPTNSTCNYPTTNFEANSLIAGVAGQVGAQYRFTNVMTIDGNSLDAIVEITDITGGAVLIDIDANTSPEWQPHYTVPLPTGNIADMEFKVTIVAAGTTTPFPLDRFGGVIYDIDGANAQETVILERPGLYALDANTILTEVNGPNNGQITFIGSNDTYSGADLGPKLAVYFNYYNVPSFKYRMSATLLANAPNTNLGVVSFDVCAIDGLFDPSNTAGTNPSQVNGTNDGNSGPGTGAVFTVNDGPDTDGDGISDDKDLDSDNDGITDVIESGGIDYNNDGHPDNGTGTYDPTDVDADGLPSVLNGTSTISMDSDGDGVNDVVDLDSDNDGIADVIEAGGTDPDNDGQIGSNPIVDVDQDGLADSVDPLGDDGPGGTATTGTPLVRPDSDGDGHVDYLDLDSDNDGVADVVEAGGVDPDGDGVIGTGSITDANHNGWSGDADVIESGNSLPYSDNDQDGLYNWIDIDADNDGIMDIVENGGVDNDHDGHIDYTTSGDPSTMTDTDNDGFADSQDTDNNGVNLATSDSDSDGLPNYLDIDADNDGIVDNIEGQSTSGYVAPSGNDTDNDGLDDAYDADDQTTVGIQNTTSGVAIVNPENTDNADLPDYLDLDSDNDGDSDALEGWDTDNDGIADTTPSGVDSDNDGLDDAYDTVVLDATNGASGDNATNGGTTPNSFPNMDTAQTPELDWREADNDADGITDLLDIDDDNDGIPDVVENGGVDPNAPGAVLLDTDGDGIPNIYDLDSDNDGIPDLVEAGGVDSDGDGIVDNMGDDDSDGIPNNVDIDNIGDPLTDDLNNDGINDQFQTGTDTDGDGIADAYDADADGNGMDDLTEANPLPNSDTDGDGVVNVLDLDSDNDGITDIVEAGGVDLNGDGQVDYATAGDPTTMADVDGDGFADVVDQDDNSQPGSNDGGINLPNPDTDGDGVVNVLDLDSDNDGITDIVEAGGIDTDGDGKVPINSDGTLVADADNDGLTDDPVVDTDNDGIADQAVDVDVAGGVEIANPDTDNDGKPDVLDIDSDNDGITDIIEAGGVDADGDGHVDYATAGDPSTMLDADNDGLTDAPVVDTDNDGVADQPIDTDVTGGMPIPNPDSDNDGLTDGIDIDADNDGIVDNIEGQTTVGYIAPSGSDNDNDGLDDAYDADDEGQVGIGNGTGSVLNPVDTDMEGIPDYLDLDSDNDGEGDLVEGHDMDGDGTPETVPSGQDADNDGLDDAFDVDDSVINPTNGQVPTDFADADLPGIGDMDWRELDNDGDGINDFVDLDDDNDGIPDYVEMCGPGATDFSCASDPSLDDDGDGILNMNDPDNCTLNAHGICENLDTDNDGIPDVFDLDSDNDGIADIVEGGGVDNNNDGVVDNINPNGTLSDDANNDGISDDNALPNPPDFDNDGHPDFQDVDSDNDGIMDIVEDGGVDTNNDGLVDSVNPDGSLSDDPDGDGWTNTTPLDGQEDTDNDGHPDRVDLDSDNDGIADITEDGGVDTDGDGMIDNFNDADNDGADDDDMTDGLTDTDEDGIPDHEDLDSDNDGIADIVEGGGIDSNGDGIVDSVNSDGTLSDDANNDGLSDDNSLPTPPDFDNDGHPDFQDLDSDNDGITDIVEDGGTDANGDGYVDTFDPTTGTLSDDTDGNGWSDNNTTDGQEDTDNDGHPDRVDLDSDNDGIADIVEDGGTDADGDGMIDTFNDANNDGADDDDMTDGLEDTDNDGIADHEDLDSDNDGIPDIIEDGGADANGDGMIDDFNDANNDGADDDDMTEGTLDTDNDGIPDHEDLDSDNDGIADVEEAGGTDVNGDGIIDDFTDANGDGWDDANGTSIPLDTDEDGLADYVDLDSDNDGINDVIEGHPYDTGVGLDADGDGMIDDVVDSNNDGWSDDNGTSTGNVPDTDGDGIPDYQDLDSDNDGVNDDVEWDITHDGVGFDDCDNDGTPNYLDMDICNVSIPEGFSPNGDGINDYFVIDGMEYYPNSTLIIFNRWGDKVYESTNYQNNWNGKNIFGVTFGGEDLPIGTYFYIFEPQRSRVDGETIKPTKGYVYLNR